MMTRTSSLDKLIERTELTQLIEKAAGFVAQAAKVGMPIHEVERGVLAYVLEMGKALLSELFAAQGTGDLGESYRLPCGREIQRLPQLHPRNYRSIFGDFELLRTVYGSREKQKIELVPLDQRLALPESDYSHVLQDWGQMLGVETSFAKAKELLENILSVKIPVDSLERTNRAMAGDVPSFRESRPAPLPKEEGPILVVTADNKGIPMRRPAGQSPAGMRRKKGEKANKKQMATVGCVYTVDRNHRTPEEVVAALFREQSDRSPDQKAAPRAKQKRICSCLSMGDRRGQDEVFAWMADEAGHRLDHAQEVVCLMDGQDSLWKDQQRYLNFEDKDKVEILDLLHVTSRVWQAAHLFHREGSQEAAAFAKARIQAILEGKVGYVIGGLRQMATKRCLAKSKVDKLETICGYFHKNKHRMRYDVYLAKGYPIASGVIEGACRYVIKDRMERAGMRWTVEGAQAMLDLRTTYVNDQWEEFQTYRIEREIQRLHPHRCHIVATPLPIAA